MYFFIELAARAANLPDTATPKEKARTAILSLLRGASAPAIATAIQKADVKVIANIVRIVYPGTKARQRDFLMAQLIAAFIKIADEDKPYKMQKVHPRRKAAAVAQELVKLGEEFDWTKSAKAGFNIEPANLSASNKDGVDLFTGEVMDTVSRRLKSYNITPAAYRKLFNAPNARTTSVKYSSKQKTSLPKGTQVPDAPFKAGSKSNPVITKLRVIRNAFTAIGLPAEKSSPIIAQFNELISMDGRNVTILSELDELHSDLSDLRVTKEQRVKLGGVMANLMALIKSVEPPPKSAKKSTKKIKSVLYPFSFAQLDKAYELSSISEIFDLMSEYDSHSPEENSQSIDDLIADIKKSHKDHPELRKIVDTLWKAHEMLDKETEHKRTGKEAVNRALKSGSAA